MLLEKKSNVSHKIDSMIAHLLVTAVNNYALLFTYVEPATVSISDYESKTKILRLCSLFEFYTKILGQRENKSLVDF